MFLNECLFAMIHHLNNRRKTQNSNNNIIKTCNSTIYSHAIRLRTNKSAACLSDWMFASHRNNASRGMALCACCVLRVFVCDWAGRPFAGSACQIDGRLSDSDDQKSCGRSRRRKCITSTRPNVYSDTHIDGWIYPFVYCSNFGYDFSTSQFDSLTSSPYAMFMYCVARSNI